MNISIESKTDGKASGARVLFISKQDIEGKGGAKPFQALPASFRKEGIFKGGNKESFFLPSFAGGKGNHILIGIGDEAKLDYEGVRRAGARAFKSLKQNRQKHAVADMATLIKKQTSDMEKTAQALTEGLILADYDCADFKKKDKSAPCVDRVTLHFPEKTHKKGEEGLKKGQILGTAVNTIRKLANYPGNLMTPDILAREAVSLTKNTKIKTTVWDKARIKKEKMGGLYGVSLGSSEEPRFIIMEYRGAGAKEKPVCLVGKGLTFDSGGISLKPAATMFEMKFDMCGSAAVLGALLAVEKLNLKVNVLGLIPSSENMPGASANKPGDILKARNGKTMEVLNTDAEGRLILADALSYACEQKPRAIFDAATLTGAVLISLGNIFTGFFTKNDELVEKIEEAGRESGERLWRLPLTEEHSQDIKGTLADVANISSTYGAGSSTAAAFLENFVDKNIPWAHFDIAGTAWNTANRLEYCKPKTASGVMVRTFVELVRSFEK